MTTVAIVGLGSEGDLLSQATGAMAGLHIDTQRMRTDLDRTGGLIVAEAVLMALAPDLGRHHAE